MKKIFISAVLFLTILGITNAQDIAFNKYSFPNHKLELSNALNQVKVGDKFYDAGPGMYRLAIDHYKKAYDFNPNNALLNYKIGRCYLDANDKALAIKYLENAIELNPKISISMKHNDSKYLLAQAFHLDYQFDKAIQNYQEYENDLNPELLNQMAETVEKKINECKFAKELTANPTNVFVDNLGDVVNSAYPDYKPLVVPEENMIIYTSSRESTTGENRAKDSYYFEDIFVTYFKDGNWTVPKNDYDINGTNHDATAGISSDGTILYIYKASGGNALFESYLVNNEYDLADKLSNTVNAGFKQASAALSFDKTMLYFTSIRKDGYGGQDIYISKKDAKDRWQEPENIGATINTPFDEEGVFISPDSKTLYFSSKGHNTIGGYDIFKSEFIDGEWSNPENLGYPINTPDNDVFFTMAKNGLRAYYSSKKEDGYGGHDLYIITFLGASKPMILSSANTSMAYNSSKAKPEFEAKIEMNTVLSGVILDAVTLEPIQANIEIYDNTKNELIAEFESSSSSGEYLLSLKPGINYGISVNKENYLFHSENFDIPVDAAAKKIKKDILLKRVEVGTKVVLNNIFFDFNKSSLRPESMAELDRLNKLMEEIATLKIEISGHTDNIGSATYNQKLSQNRAMAVSEYLRRKGISNTRLEYKGYGFTEPVATNETEQGRQQNRRTEFKILEK